MPDTEVVKHRRKRQPKPEGSIALKEIDRRLAEALGERQTAIVNVSKLAYWQDRLTRVNQEIESLIGYQQRLNGQPVTVAATSFGSMPPGINAQPWMRDVPAGVTSVPAKQPAPSGANVAEVIGTEAGFS